MTRSKLWLHLVLLAFSTGSWAQSPLPTDTELRATYCIRALQEDIKGLHEMRRLTADSIANTGTLPAEMQKDTLATLRQLQADLPQTISERESMLNRLQLYVLPRTKYPDKTALIAAMRRAELDKQEWSNLTSKCTKQCARLGQDQRAPTEATIAACFRECTSASSALHARITACHNLTWLPF